MTFIEQKYRYEQSAKQVAALQWTGNADEMQEFVGAPETATFEDGLFNVWTEHRELLKLRRGDYVVKIDGGGFQVWNEKDFEREFYKT